MVSPRPSCISAPVSMMDSPPSWRMPTSNDTRVRVDGRSKIIERLAFQRLLALLMRLQLRLHGEAGIHDVAQFPDRHFADVEEMSWRLAHHPAAFFFSVADSATQARSRH